MTMDDDFPASFEDEIAWITWFETASDVNILFWLTTSFLPQLAEESETVVAALLLAADSATIDEVAARAFSKSEVVERVAIYDLVAGHIVFMDERVRQALTEVKHSPALFVSGDCKKHSRFRTLSSRIKHTRNPQPVRVRQVKKAA